MLTGRREGQRFGVCFAALRSAALAIAIAAMALIDGGALAASDAAGQSAPPAAPSIPERPSPFDALASAPADVSLWIRLSDASGWLADPTAGPFVQAVSAALSGAIEGDARSPSGVRAIADRLGLSPVAAFDRYLGRDARFVLRGSGASLEWCVVTRVAEPDVEALARSLGVVARAGGIFEAPEQHVVFAHRGEWLVVGRDTTSELFRECAERGALELSPNLRDAVATSGLDAAALTGMGQGRLAVVLRGSEPFVGTTALLADVRDGHLRGGVRGQYAESPFPGAKPRELDVSILSPFEERTIGAQLDPIRTEIGPNDAFLIQTFPELRPTPAGRANFADRRLILIGEVDGATAVPPLAMKCPAIAVAYEVDDAVQGLDDQDRMMTALVATVQRRFPAAQRRDRVGAVTGDTSDGTSDGSQKATYEEMPPVTLPASRETPRRVDAAPWVERYFGNHPLLRSTSLNWQTVRNGDRAWQVYATHPAWLAEVAGQLAALPVGEALVADRQRISSAGHCCGPRLANHLRSWTGESRAFAAAAADVDADAQGFTKGIELIASVAERFRSVRWSMAMPTERTLELALDAELAPVSSSSPPASPKGVNAPRTPSR